MNRRSERYISQEILDELQKKLPDVFLRRDVSKLVYGILSKNTLANLSSTDKGPPEYRVGRKIAYMKKTFLPWLEQHFNSGGGYEGADEKVPGGAKGTAGAAKGGGPAKGEGGGDQGGHADHDAG